MKIAIASDHAGFALKEELKPFLKALGHEIGDLGAYSGDTPDDYPDFAEKVGEALNRNEAERAVLICGSGVGVSVAANKIPGIRAGMCHDCYSAHQGVEHDDMNVLVLGSRIIGGALARDLVETYLSAKFQASEERFVRRLNKVKAIERKYMPAAAQLPSSQPVGKAAS